MMTPSQELIERVADLENRVAQVLRHIALCRLYDVEPNTARIEGILRG